jgi:hypothetical protein
LAICNEPWSLLTFGKPKKTWLTTKQKPIRKYWYDRFTTMKPLFQFHDIIYDFAYDIGEDGTESGGAERDR